MRVHAVVINPKANIDPGEIVRLINIYQAVKQKRAFNKRIAFRARWKEEETNGQGLQGSVGDRS